EASRPLAMSPASGSLIRGTPIRNTADPRIVAGSTADKRGPGLIEFRDVTKTFGDEVAVEHFSLQVPARRITVLVGSSGSGKTTLLRMINRMVDPTSGTVEI